MVGPSYKENIRLISLVGEQEEKEIDKKKQTESQWFSQLTLEELGQSIHCWSASHRWMTTVIKND